MLISVYSFKVIFWFIIYYILIGLFTLLILYIFWYLIIFCIIFFFFKTHLIESDISQLSFKQIFIGTSRLFDRGFVFKFLILHLAGLPPFILFLAKLGLLLKVGQSGNLFLFLLIFINVLLGQFFYLKPFVATVYKQDNHSLKLFCKKSLIDMPKRKYNLRFYRFFYMLSAFSVFNIIVLGYFMDFVTILHYV